MDRLRILALGSPHGDDQLAWMAAARLQSLPEYDISVHLLSSPWDLLHHLSETECAIVLDACQSGAPAGTIARWTRDNLAELPAERLSTHAGGLREALQMAEALRSPMAEVVVLTAEIEACEPVAALSESAQRSADSLVRAVVAEIQSRGADCRAT